MAIAAATFAVQASADRYFGDHGWLKTYHSFSFAEYVDPRFMNWGALRVFNEDRVAPGAGFPTHPHTNMEILTYVLEGKLEHRDTLGSHGIVDAGGVQFMSAGTGLRHSEYNASPDRPLHFVQMWVLPGRLNVEPSYGQVDFDADARRNVWLDVASGQARSAAPIRLTQDATLRVSRLEDAALDLAFAPGRLGFLFVAAGDIAVTATDAGRDQRAQLRAGDALRFGGVDSIGVQGGGELILWEVPPVAAE